MSAVTSPPPPPFPLFFFIKSALVGLVFCLSIIVLLYTNLRDDIAPTHTSFQPFGKFNSIVQLASNRAVRPRNVSLHTEPNIKLKRERERERERERGDGCDRGGGINSYRFNSSTNILNENSHSVTEKKFLFLFFKLIKDLYVFCSSQFDVECFHTEL